ncbi:LOW QUALITY PROTEIN: uncharacterized protein LOC131190532 [Ahaetulla prasina]|uniref:LOW QUALITY PROTEIN: uncharacterized protein LOC131190532 n=1 Tax=Ahaetulla prasina TaxID=499056 RepID=UPI00264720CC|nr:LOW QUALITY PROTEIN: uncharacterized protein LOC131190532 [Ahaetulla prasina]
MALNGHRIAPASPPYHPANWILDLPLDNFWIGLNNLEETQSFSWSEGTRTNASSWFQLSNPVQPNTCVKVSKHSLVAVSCDTNAHWICQRSAVAERYQEHKGKVLLSPKGSMSQVHTDLISAKIACMELREQCTGITTWNNAYALARGTVLLKSKEKQSVAYVKSDCSLGYFGMNCSSVCNRCYGDELCNPYTGDCDVFHSCRSQDSPAVCEQDLGIVTNQDRYRPPLAGTMLLNYEKAKYKRVDLFDLYTDKFLSGPLDPKFYTTLSTAVLDCLSDANCSGIVQDSRFFRRTRGIDEITASDENVFTYKKRECSLGYYGNNCGFHCKKCHGGFKCNSITGKCPERLYCHGQFKGELCELGLKNPKCPHNAPWWYFDGHCYYFEKEKKGDFAWAEKRCSYYKDSFLVWISNEKEKEDVFKDCLGKYKGTPISFNLDPQVAPIRLKARRVPFALKPKIDKELDKLINQGILVPVDHAKRRQVFAKLDLAQAYQQLPVDARTAEAQTIVTHRGAFKCTRLQFGVNKKGIHPTESKVKAIRKAPAPKNKAELQAFLGLVNFYAVFLKNKATVAEPLHRLLGKNTVWSWGKSEHRAFEAVKNLLSSDSLLIQYHNSLPLMLVCDASPYGVGAVLSHRLPNGTEAPIAFYSRTMSAPERNYSQLDKETLAIVSGVKKFHEYVFGRDFEIVTDHRPLIGILAGDRPTPVALSPRLTRWTIFLAAYSYKLQHRPGKEVGHADALSRCPLPGAVEDPTPGTPILLIDSLDSGPVTSKEVARASYRDIMLRTVLGWVQRGWPAAPGERFKEFVKKRDELSAQGGCLLWGDRVVIPDKLRGKVLDLLHEGHPGIVRMKGLARSYVWWPLMDSEIAERVGKCQACQESRPLPPTAPVREWEKPQGPWSRIHIDFAGPFHGQTFLVVVDAFSKWLEIILMKSTTAEAVIATLRHLFATHGLPDTLVSDNGPQFTAAQFEEYLAEEGIRHALSAPFHPASNGLAERSVRSAKEALSRLKPGDWQTKIDFFLAVQHRTPSTATGRSPAELLMGRKLRCPLDRLSPHYTPEGYKGEIDKTREFDIGDRVWARNYRDGPSWFAGQIIKTTGPKSYLVELQDNRVWRRHIVAIASVSERCPDMTKWRYWKRYCYYFVSSFDTWEQANSSCSRFRASELLWIEDKDDLVWLQEMIKQPTWVGLKWHEEIKEWLWGDGTSTNTSRKWLKIQGNTLDSCGTLIQRSLVLRSIKCENKLNFICKRKEDVNIFEKYEGHIIPQREMVLPKSFSNLRSAEEECIFEKTICTGVVFSQKHYHMENTMSVVDLLARKPHCDSG